MIITKNVSGAGWKTSTQKAETFAKFLFLQQPKPKNRIGSNGINMYDCAFFQTRQRNGRHKPLFSFVLKNQIIRNVRSADECVAHLKGWL